MPSQFCVITPRNTQVHGHVLGTAGASLHHPLIFCQICRSVTVFTAMLSHCSLQAEILRVVADRYATSGLCWQSEGLQQLEKWEWQELHEAWQIKVQSSAPGEEQSQAREDVRGHSAGKQTGRKGPGGPGGHQVKHKSAIHPLSQRRTTSPWLYYTKYHKQVKRGDPIPLLSIAKAVHVCNSGLSSTTKVWKY